MHELSFPTLEPHRPATPEKEIDGRSGSISESARSYSSFALPSAGGAAIGKPISSMMERNMWTVDAESSVAEVELTLSGHGLSSVPVVGSNGAIVGIIGPQELAHFLSRNGNAKAVRAWEISRCTVFEVGPDDAIEDVAKLMADNKIEYIAVTELGALKGVVSALDLLQTVLKAKTVETTLAPRPARRKAEQLPAPDRYASGSGST